MMRRYGIVQGRLSNAPPNVLQHFPQENWTEEFSASENLRLSFIELLSERQFNNANPIWSSIGRETILSLNEQHSLDCESICSDYIIDHNMFAAGDHGVDNHLDEFIVVCRSLRVKKLILPLLEESAVNPSQFDLVAGKLRKLCQRVQSFGCEVAIESLLPAKELVDLIDLIGVRNVGVVFDSGNRINKTEKIYDEVLTLGDKITHVHVKDKNSANQNVLLGTGNVDFVELFSALRDIHYSGAFVFETHRGRSPQRTARYNVQLCEFFMNEVGFE